MYEDCLDFIITKIDSVNLFDSITGELVTSFNPEGCTISTITTDTTPNTLFINDVPFITFDYKNYGSYINNNSYIKFINKLADELNKKEEEKMIKITDVDV